MGCSSWVPWVMHACPRTPWAKGEGTFYLFAGLGAATPRITDPALSWPGIGGRVCVYVVVWTGPPPPPPPPKPRLPVAALTSPQAVEAGEHLHAGA